jgi:N-methylhydantoinase A
MRVGIDVGGTFTDFVAIDEASGAIRAWKVPSTPGREHEGLVGGLGPLVADGIRPSHLTHGTTVATNAILQRKGARVALVTTRGFRDAIEIGRTRRNKPNSQFDPKFVKPEPLVERPLRFELAERIGPRGEVLVPLDPDEIDRLAATLAGQGVETVAVCFLNAYVDPSHERAVAARLASRLKGVRICTSAEVHAGFQESERFATTALNAYLIPVMARYLGRLEGALQADGVDAPFLVMGSGGGTMTAAEAAVLPVRTIVSGPAGGVIAAAGLCEALGLDDVVTYDMGGTSTDVAVVRGRRPTTTTQTVVDGLPMVGAMLEISTVGAGAGSIAAVAADGGIAVGPESAGAEPGPVCYGKGGAEITVTDANLVLGRLNPERALGGRILPDRVAAEAALAEAAGRVPGLSPLRLAEGVIAIAVARMVGAVREISVERGLDPRGFALVAYGGAGPMHAALVARELAMREVIVPRLPGNFSALGLLCADMRAEGVTTVLAGLDPAGIEAVLRARRALVAQGEERLARDGIGPDRLTVEASVDMRFSGQAALFRVPLPERLGGPEALRRLFLDHYAERYGHANASRAIEIEAVRVVAIGRLAKPAWERLAAPAPAPDDLPPEPDRREVVFDGEVRAAAIFERDRLPPGFEADGPAVVEEDGATTVVPPGWRLRVDRLGNLRLAGRG